MFYIFHEFRNFKVPNKGQFVSTARRGRLQYPHRFFKKRGENYREWSTEHNTSTYSVLTHTLDLWGGVKCQNIFFAESSHVAYQINVNGAQSTIQAPIPYLHTPSTPGVGQKVETFFLLKVVMLHMKLKGIEHRAPCKHTFCPYTHPQTPDGIKR